MDVIESSTFTQLDKLNVLIIDDNLLVHNILKESLYALGIREIRCAENAYYGLRLCEDMRFHIVICAFNVKSDKDGFHLLEELKFKGHVTRTTVLIFLSSDTDESLVNSIIELQPDDFWAKPLAINTVQKRLTSTLKNKQVLFNIHNAIDHKEFSKAIYYADRHFLNAQLSSYFPVINRMKGESYIALREFKDAENFYKSLLEQYQYSWVYLGYAKALLKQDRLADIESLLTTLIDKPDTRFGAHDMMAQYYIEHEEFQLAYVEIQKAMKLAPRNIERNKKLWDLARLTQDYKGQYLATRNIAQHAKNSIHDSPEHLLNVIRASIDLACATPDDNSGSLLKQTERYIDQLENGYADVHLLKQQLLVVKARLHNVRREEHIATRLIEAHLSLKPAPCVEDNLDKVKVLHELGMREEAIDLLKAIKNQIAGDSLASQAVNRYVEQQAIQREEIHFTAKQLNSMAVEHFQKNRLEPALDAIKQALKINPSNVKLLLSQLKILIKLKQQNNESTAQVALAQKTVLALEELELEPSVASVVEDIIKKWHRIGP